MTNTHFDTNGYGEVTNGPGTVETTADYLTEYGSVVLDWTDQEGSLLNVLLVLDPDRVGSGGGAIDSGPNKLWVGVAKHGAFAFGVDRGYLAPDYVAEKLGIYSLLTATVLAELLTAVRTRLAT